MFDKTDKKLTLDEETKNFFEEIENREKTVDKMGFTKYFSYEPTALVNKLLGQNTQDLRKSLDEIKEQNIKLNKDERNSTNDRSENDRLNMILGVIDRIYQFFEHKVLPGEQSDKLRLPKWVKVNKKRFNEILSTVTKAKNEGLRTNVDGREITLDNSESLVKDLGNGILDGNEFENRCNDIANDVKAIVNKASITRNQAKIVEILSLLKEIPKLKNLMKNQILQTCLN